MPLRFSENTRSNGLSATTNPRTVLHAIGLGSTFTQDGTGAVSRTVAERLRDTIHVFDFIPVSKHQAILDSTSSDDVLSYVNSAIAAVPAKGGTVFFPRGLYCYSDTIVLGDGSASAVSTQQNVKLLGDGSGGTGGVIGTFDATRAAVRFKYIGTAQLDDAIEVKGPMAIGIENIQYDCNGGKVDTGFRAYHTFRSHFRNLNFVNFKLRGIRVDGFASLPSGCFIGAAQCVWDNVHAYSSGFGICDGLDIGGSVAGTTSLHKFIGSTFQVQDDSSGNSIILRGCDNISFDHCFTVSAGQRRAIGVKVIPPSGSTAFPSEISFIHCPLIGGVSTPTDGTWDPASNGGHGLNFFPLNVGDMEAPGFTGTKTMPTNSVAGSIRGWASDGRQVGGCLRPDVTAATYTVKQFDNNNLITFNRATAIAVTLPNASDLGFRAGWWTEVQSRGAGAVTITPTTATIDGAATLVLNKNQGCRIFSDGTNYFTQRGEGGNTGQHAGTATNDSASAGNVGEFISSTIAKGSAVALTTGVTANVTTISLTAGDWDVSGIVAVNPNAATTMDYVFGAVSVTSATLPTDGAGGQFFCKGHGATNNLIQQPTGTIRVSLSATTTYYLVCQSGFGTNTNAAYGYIGARRVR